MICLVRETKNMTMFHVLHKGHLVHGPEEGLCVTYCQKDGFSGYWLDQIG